MVEIQPDQLMEGGLPPARAGAGGDGLLRLTGGSKSRGELSFRGGDAPSRRTGRPREKAPSGRKAPSVGKAAYRGGQFGRAGRSHMDYGGVDPSNPAVGRQLDPAVSRRQVTVRGSQPSAARSIRSVPSTRSISLLERDPGEAVLSPPAADGMPLRRPRSTTTQPARSRCQKCGPRLGSLLCLGRRFTSPTPSPTRSCPSPALDPRRPSNSIPSQSLRNATMANPPKGPSDISLITPPRLERPGSSLFRDQTAPGAGCQRDKSRAVQPSQKSYEVRSTPPYASLDDSIGDQQIVRAQSARSLQVVPLYQGATAPGCAARAGTAQAGKAQVGTIQADPSRGTAAPERQISSAMAKKQKSTSRAGFQAAAAPQSGGAGRAIEVTPPAGEIPASRATRPAERVQTRPVPYLPHFPEAPQVGETTEPYRSLTIRTSIKGSSSSKKKKSKKSTTAQPQAASIESVKSQSSLRRQRPSTVRSDAASVPLTRSQPSLKREQPSVAQSETARITSLRTQSSLRREQPSAAQPEAVSIILARSLSSLRRERPSAAQSEAASFVSPRPSSSTSSIAAAEPLSFNRSKGTSVVQSPSASTGCAGCPTSSGTAGQWRGADELRQDRFQDAVQAAKTWATSDRAPANRTRGSRTSGDGSWRDSDRFSQQSSPSTTLRRSSISGRVTPPKMISVTERIRRQEEIIRAQQASGFRATIGSPNSPATRPVQPSSGISPDVGASSLTQLDP
ncbi:hypothetical protein EPUS_04679 [Endocarpon pusillum Z07020]|uniref:Uncharacterized protein n=1 Tax=Endocarpon pusillum (strain Z07020 / HMAS-L-300199) TaxID=1263415 RepID=U1GA76_ENDPU|nr:uncharacterized protein EPUS_04679 [Endocarpon pusillum Z07020]ERF68581.1 hypothetical protein EPUS_04679 [Endocarpon pusillum Z07020]